MKTDWITNYKRILIHDKYLYPSLNMVIMLQENILEVQWLLRQCFFMYNTLFHEKKIEYKIIVSHSIPSTQLNCFNSNTFLITNMIIIDYFIHYFIMRINLI